MREDALLADHLDQQGTTILAHWREAVGRGAAGSDGRPGGGVTPEAVPPLLRRLADRLRGKSVAASLEGPDPQYWRQGDDLAAVVAGLGHLRTTLRQATAEFARDHAWDLHRLVMALDAVNDVLDAATAEAVRHYQDAGRRDDRRRLTELTARREAIENAYIDARLDQAKLRAVLRCLPAAVWVVDSAGSFLGANDQAERMQGFAQDGGRGRANIHDLGTDDYDLRDAGGDRMTADRLPVSRALRGETVDQVEVAWRQNGGRTLPVAFNAAPVRDADGAVIGAVVVGLDLTERKRLEGVLATAQEQFRVIAERSPVLTWRTDASGRCDFVNQTWCEFLGAGPEAHMGEGRYDGVHPEDRPRYRAEVRSALARQAPFETSFRLRRHDGQYRWVSDRGTPLHDPRGEFLGLLGSCLDITPRIELETELERQRATAEQASLQKTRLVSALSHDVRTPLNAVVLAAQLLEIHYEASTDPEVIECLRTIRHSVRNVMDLLNDLLDLSKIDAGAAPAELTRFPLGPVLAECLASIEPQARVKGLDVRLEPQGLDGLVLESDRPKLKQVLSNLLSNALRYTDRGSIRVTAERAAGLVRVSVADTGLGIAVADQAKIFEEFATLDYPGRRAGEGTGLGLAICRRLANLLRGEITLDSVPGQGSTFTVSLPVAPESTTAPLPAPAGVGRADDAADDDDAPADPDAGRPVSGAVVVAEDHAESRRTLARVVRRMGFRVLEAGDGREALDLARAAPDLRAVLMDVNMPGMGGLEATLAFRADDGLKGVPVFALTGDVTAETRRRLAGAGVNGFLEKPVSWDALRDALATHAGPHAG